MELAGAITAGQCLYLVYLDTEEKKMTGFRASALHLNRYRNRYQKIYDLNESVNTIRPRRMHFISDVQIFVKMAHSLNTTAFQLRR